MVFQNHSAWLRAAQALFDVERSEQEFHTISHEKLDNQVLELLRRQILDVLDLDVTIPARPNDVDLMLATFGRVFPTTREMCAFARTQVEVDLAQPDDVLIRWLAREEELFMALESVVISEQLAIGFQSVDEFIQYSLSIQNRRKSRMGFALQNHLAEIFTQLGLRFTPQARTEGNNRPDFIFPGQAEYHDEAFNKDLLVMLGAKSTAKDRWRQVLDEADRVKRKHLCTLEPGISTKQTDAIRNRLLTLVIPTALHKTYTSDQRKELLSLEHFLEFVREKQIEFTIPREHPN